MFVCVCVIRPDPSVISSPLGTCLSWARCSAPLKTLVTSHGGSWWFAVAWRPVITSSFPALLRPVRRENSFWESWPRKQTKPREWSSHTCRRITNEISWKSCLTAVGLNIEQILGLFWETDSRNLMHTTNIVSDFA